MSIKLHCDGPDCLATLDVPKPDTFADFVREAENRVTATTVLRYAQDHDWSLIWLPPRPPQDLCPACTAKWFQSTGGVV